MYSLLRSVASSSSSSPNFPNCSSPRESAAIFADYPRSYFSVSQPMALGVAEPEATLPSSAGPHALRSLTFSSAHPFLPLNFLRLPPTSPRPLPLAQTKCLSHAKAPSSLWRGFSSSIFPGLCISFLPSGRLLYYFHQQNEKASRLPPLWPISLTSCVLKLFERITLSRLLFFLESYSILSPGQAGFRPGRSTSDQIQYLSQMGLSNQDWALGRSSLLSISPKLLTLSGISPFFHKLISAGLPPCFARWTQSFHSDRRACVFFQNHKSRSLRVH